MDGQRFDRWTKSVATGATRRSVVAGLAAGALAALGLGLGGGTVEARPPRRFRNRLFCNAACRQQCRDGCAANVPRRQQAACRQACEACGSNYDYGSGECDVTTCSINSGCFGAPCFDTDHCFCATSTENNGLCLRLDDASCDNPRCDNSGDCGGGVCVPADECCGSGVKVCITSCGVG